ncbi:MAG: hypothetical protein ACRDPW_03075 [Mycobacteriales bacterium]
MRRSTAPDATASDTPRQPTDGQWCWTIRSYLATATKHGTNFLHALTEDRAWMPTTT